MSMRVHYQHGTFFSLTSKYQAFLFPDILTKMFHYFKVMFLGHWLALWKKFMVNNALRIEKTVSMTFNVLTALVSLFRSW
jgi:hypothetical protein